MLTLILGRAGSGKTTEVIGEIACLGTRPDGKVYLIVPEQHSHATERLLCEVGGNTVSGFAEVVSFRRLCGSVASVAGGLAKKCIGEGERILLLNKALRQANPALKTLVRAASQPEFISELLYSINELKSYNISPAELMECAESAPRLMQGKLSELALIYSAYLGAFGQGEIDAYDELDLLFDNIKKTEFFKGKTVYFDGFSGFTEQEFNIIGLILKTAKSVTMTFCVDEDAAEGIEKQVFSKARETTARIIELASRNGCEYTIKKLTENRRAKTAQLRHVERELYRAKPQKLEGEATGITVSRAADSFEECELAAGYISKLVRDYGYRYRDICVTARDIDGYSGDLEAVFERYGIPVYLNRKAPILDKPVIALIVNALSCIKSGFKYDFMLSYLKTGLTGIRRASLDLLENYLYIHNVQGRMWTREQGFTMSPDGADGELTEESAKELKNINKIREKIRTPLINLRDALKADKTGAGAAGALYNYLNEINLPRKLTAQGRLYTLRGMPAQAAEYRALWNILCDIIDSIGRTLSRDEVKPDELISLIKLLASQYDIGMIPVALDRVDLSQFERIGEGRARVLIVLGATDDSMPRCGEGRGLITDAERETLLELGVRMNPGASARMDEEFRLIYNAFSAPDEKLYISYPNADITGAKARKSMVVMRLEKLFDKLFEYDIADARMQAPIPCFDVLATGDAGGFTRAATEYFKERARYAELLRIAERNASLTRGPIEDRENIDALFGRRITLSASRADKFSSCRYAYFMQYGLRAAERRVKSLDALEIGSFIHSILETTFRRIKENGGIDKTPLEQALRFASRAVSEFVKERLNGFTDKSQRFIYLFKRLDKVIKTVIENIYEELRASLFLPLDFELKFSDKNGDIPALRIKGEDFELALEGYVDRIDGYEKDDTLYVRVIDYKTGSKSFSLNEVLNGIGMQLLLYLFTLESLGEKRYKKTVVPAGVLYVPISDGMVGYAPDDTEDAQYKYRDSKARRKGVLLGDKDILVAMDSALEDGASRYLPVSIKKDGEFSKSSSVLTAEEFRKVYEHIRGLLSEIGRELTRGVIEANPYYNGNYSACDFCAYKSACHFDEISGSEKKRQLIKTKFLDFREGEV